MVTLAAKIDANGISAPSYADIYAQYQNAFWTIYGTDSDLDDDSQDGQFLAITAAALNDANQTAIDVYNSRSPASAQGVGLSSVVKINGIRRLVPSNSTAPVTLTGTAGTPVVGGLIGDDLQLGTQWSIPNVTIGDDGTVDTTATCVASGAVTAAEGTLSVILTPTGGWFEVTSTADATTGAPTENDATLRQRQGVSTSLPAQTPLAAINANVANVAGVQRLKCYENDTDITDGNGIPSHSISVVVQGGAVADIAQAIFDKKNPGTGTFGTTTDVVIDENGVPDTINYFVLEEVAITVAITVHPLSGWSTSTETLIQQAVAAYLSSLGIGVTDYLNKLWGPANLSGDVALAGVNAYLATLGQSAVAQSALDVISNTYNVTIIAQSTGGATSPDDIAILFNQAAAGDPTRVTVATA